MFFLSWLETFDSFPFYFIGALSWIINLLFYFQTLLHKCIGASSHPADRLWLGSWCVAGIQEGAECTKCKNDWVLRAAIALLYVLCALLTIAVAVLGYKGKFRTIQLGLWMDLLGMLYCSSFKISLVVTHKCFKFVFHISPSLGEGSPADSAALWNYPVVWTPWFYPRVSIREALSLQSLVWIWTHNLPGSNRQNW